jgi:hypothetical protein
MNARSRLNGETAASVPLRRRSFRPSLLSVLAGDPNVIQPEKGPCGTKTMEHKLKKWFRGETDGIRTTYKKYGK